MDMKSSNTRNWEGVNGDDMWGATSSPPAQVCAHLQLAHCSAV